MRFYFIISILLFFPLLVIQTTVVQLVSINGVVPDLILILLVFYAVKYGQIYGTVLGFIYGFLFDLITGSLIGSAMLSKTIAGFIAGYFSNENKREVYLKSYVFSLIVLLCCLADSVVYSFFSSIDLSKSILVLFFEQAMLPALYTAVISIIVSIFYPKRSMG
jgi:rod shape-determining protein MreD